MSIAVSEAAAWTGRRFYGGRYRIIPNGVVLPDGGVPAPRARAAGEPLRIVFVGQAVERKGLPVLLRAFEALRGQIPAELTVIGLTPEELAPLLVEGEGVTALGRVDDVVKSAVLHDADVLCAPSLGGESFGMVLTEAFAAGTPVVASDIAGYRDVVSTGVDGLLVPRGNATALAGDAARPRAGPGAGRRTRPRRGRGRGALRVAARGRAGRDGLRGRDRGAGAGDRDAPCRGEDRRGARGRPAPRARDAPAVLGTGAGARRGAALRRGAIGLASLATVVGAVLAVDHIGPARIGDALVRSSPPWVLFGLALMCASMLLRAVSWHAILKAALPGARPKFADAVQGTTIGVLMSATLPARLGEPSRALIVARRLGRARDRLPVVLGTIVSQTLINVFALVILGAVMFITIGLFAGKQQALLWYALAPIGLLVVVLVAPALIRSGRPARSRWVAQGRDAVARVRSGLVVFKRPREGFVAITMQLGAWALQWVSCYVLLVALGLEHKADLGAAAAILFAVNVTAVLPVTPSNVGVFQAACMAVLVGAYGVAPAQALGYGIILQAVEVACAVVMGGPALVKEGLSWREVRLRAMHSAPVRLSPGREHRSRPRPRAATRRRASGRRPCAAIPRRRGGW